MRKIYLSLGCVASALLASAQLPNPGFADWGECIPWTSNDTNKAVEGATQPKDWTISNVIGINGAGATIVGEKAEGIDGGNAVMVKNSPNSLLSTQTVPGYFTLGTTWSTSVMGQQNDGGTFGGIKLATRPDGVHFSYKRTAAADAKTTATVVAYSWKGTYTQKDVPGNIIIMGKPDMVDMVNRDRNILGMETAKGGEVEKTEGAALVAKAIRPIAVVTDEWKELTVPMEYVSDEAPEMFNVIFAANDYFNSEEIEQGNTFTVAAPKLVYWSKLESITIDGKAIEGFDDAKYDYEVSTLPAADAVKVTVLGAAATADVKAVEGKIVITVTNADGADEEGLTEHVYTITEAGSQEPAEPAGDPVLYNGTLTVSMMGNDITGGGVDATVSITENTDGSYTFLLPNLTLGDLGTLGDISLDGVKAVTAAGITTYTGSVEHMKLMDGAIDADVNLNGTVMDDGKANMTIDVLWNQDDTQIPITCTFVGQQKSGIAGVDADNAGAPVMYFDMQGRRVADPSAAGLYIRRQGNKAVKVLVR